MKDDILVLAYHRVAVAPGSHLEVGVEQLEQHVRALLARRYRFETVTRAVEAAGSRGRLAALTFDDGDPSVVALALPLLDALGARATAFVPTAEARRLNVRPLLDAGWEIGSHGHRHVELTSLSAGELQEELRTSRELLAHECGACTSIAYPYSAADRHVIVAAERAGFRVGCTTATTPALGPLAWPRVGIGVRDGPLAFRVKTSTAGRRLRRAPLGAACAAVARAAWRAQRRATSSRSSATRP